MSKNKDYVRLYDVDIDDYGEVINGQCTYNTVAREVRSGKSIIIGWTDEECTHFDILFSIPSEKRGMLQRGLRGKELYVVIISWGAFGFDINHDKEPGYVGQKLKLGNNKTTEKLTELINGIIEVLINETI